MTAYAALFSARFRTLLQHRLAAVAGAGTQLFWGLIRMMIFEVFYRSTKSAQPMTYPEVRTYVWLGQALIMMMPWSIDQDVAALIRSGGVAYELLKPVDLYSQWYFRALAARSAPTLLRCLPIVLFAGLMHWLAPPVSAGAALAWIVTTIGALLLNAAITTLLTMSLLWTISGEGIVRAAPPVIYALSGMLVPLTLLPGWCGPILRLLPFRAALDLPFRIYVGNLPATDVGWVLLTQAGWTIGLILLGKWLISRASSRLVIQGG